MWHHANETLVMVRRFGGAHKWKGSKKNRDRSKGIDATHPGEGDIGTLAEKGAELVAHWLPTLHAIPGRPLFDIRIPSENPTRKKINPSTETFKTYITKCDFHHC